jgi:chemotaxis protein MotB
MGESAAPIIVKRVHKGDHGHHGGAWKVAYADMVTALMALFIVLWILGQSVEVQKAVSGYFSDPAGFNESAARAVEGGKQESDLSLQPEDAPPPPQPRSEESAPVLGADVGPGRSPERRWREAAEAIRDALKATPQYTRFRDQIELSVTPEGLRVSLIDDAKAPLFKGGALELDGEARALFEALGTQLSRLPNQVVLEGHTDASAYTQSPESSNWELSTGRALATRRALVGGGMHEARILEVRGYADRQLYNPLDPSDSRNRRVSITLLSEEAVRAREQLAQEKLLN